MKTLILLLGTLLISSPSFARYTEGNCLQQADATMYISYCYSDPTERYTGLGCGNYKMQQTLVWKYSENPNEVRYAPEIRVWAALAIDKAESNSQKQIRPNADALIMHIPQFIGDNGEKFLEFENIGWNLQQQYEIFPSTLKVGIDAVKGGIEVGSSTNISLVKTLMRVSPKETIWFLNVKLENPVYSSCKDLGY